jgi:hypothetical protein
MDVQQGEYRSPRTRRWLVETGPDKVIKRATRMACVAHQTDRLAEDARERVDNLHCWAEAADQTAIPIAILPECLLSFLE